MDGRYGRVRHEPGSNVAYLESDHRRIWVAALPTTSGLSFLIKSEEGDGPWTQFWTKADQLKAWCEAILAVVDTTTAVTECAHEWSDYEYPTQWLACVKCGERWSSDTTDE